MKRKFMFMNGVASSKQPPAKKVKYDDDDDDDECTGEEKIKYPLK